LTLGGPLEREKGKGRRLDWGEEVQDSLVRLLAALTRHGHAPPIPILAHTLTSLLDISLPSTTSLALRLRALSVLDVLVDSFLSPVKGLLAQCLPGTVSGLCKIVAAPSRIQTERFPILVSTLGLLAKVIVRVVADDECADLLGPQIGRLEDLASTPNPPAQGDKRAWLSATTSQLHLALVSIVPFVRDHPHPSVRLALVQLSATLLLRCCRTLDSSNDDLLVELLLASRDDWPDVAKPAQQALSQVQSLQPVQSQRILDILGRALAGLPQTILSKGDDDTRMRHACILVLAATESLPRSTLSAGGVGVAATGVERWSSALLAALEMKRPHLDDGMSGGSATTARAWMAAPAVEGGHEGDGPVSFPVPLFERIPSAESVRWVQRALAALGERAAGPLIDVFLGMARSASKTPARRASALWAVAELLDGAGAGTLDRRRTRGIVKVLVTFENEEEEEEGEMDLSGGGVEAEAADSQVEEGRIVLSERIRGNAELTTLIDSYRPGTTESSRVALARRHRADRLLVACMVLRVLGGCAAQLDSAFRSELLETLYLVLARLGPSEHSLVQAHARAALYAVAYHAGYASPTNLLVDNVDYVVNAVSRRLTPARLDPRAPGVLVAMVRLVGSEILPVVKDVVDEVVDALDAFHGYDVLASGLLAVLDALMRVLAEEAKEAPVPADESDSETSATAKRFGDPRPDPDRDLGQFEQWFAHRHDPHPDDYADAEEDVQSKRSEGEEEETPAAPPSDKPPPQTRAQAVSEQVLGKTFYFLTHPSAFLRARVLALISSAVPLLRPRELLPLIHRAWPFVVERLGDPEPFVGLEAARLVETFVGRAGDFVASRVLDDAWPRMRRLLDRREASARTGALAVSSPFTAFHRTARAVLAAMASVARKVPLKDPVAFELAIRFRRFLDCRLDGKLQEAAGDALEALAGVNADLVWLVLVAPDADSGPLLLPRSAREDEEVGQVYVESNARRILERLDG
jgi:hypothetical protein